MQHQLVSSPTGFATLRHQMIRQETLYIQNMRKHEVLPLKHGGRQIITCIWRPRDKIFFLAGTNQLPYDISFAEKFLYNNENFTSI